MIGWRGVEVGSSLVEHSRDTLREAREENQQQQQKHSKSREREMASAAGGAVPFWRAAGMTYITYSNICANLVRNCLKDPYKAEAISREKVHFSLSKWVDGKPEKPTIRTDTAEH